MAERKVISATKKVADAKIKSSSKVAGKAKAAKTTPAKTTKTPSAKKAQVAAPRKNKVAAVSKPRVAAEKKQVLPHKLPAAGIKPAATAPRPAASGKGKLTPEERYRMVETAAYFIAERHGFQGRSDEHWAAAEREIAARLGQ